MPKPGKTLQEKYRPISLMYSSINIFNKNYKQDSSVSKEL
jgi:hypothetical protein